MPDLHHELERAAALAAAAPCWFCGAAALGGVCSEDERAACFARSVRPPPGPEAHPPDCGACPESEPCGACARAYAVDDDASVAAEESEP